MDFHSAPLTVAASLSGDLHSSAPPPFDHAFNEGEPAPVDPHTHRRPDGITRGGRVSENYCVCLNP